MPNHPVRISEILMMQANRYPNLFIDRVIDHVPGKSSKCLKNFTYNEWFFPEHYYDDPNVPGFVLIECLVQSFLMTFLTLEEYRGSRTNFIDVKNVSFRRKIVPGDSLTITCELKSLKRGLANGSAIGYVDGEFACEGDFTVSLPHIMEKYRPAQ